MNKYNKYERNGRTKGAAENMLTADDRKRPDPATFLLLLWRKLYDWCENVETELKSIKSTSRALLRML